MNEDKKYPEPVVGVLIYNDNGEIFLTRSSKWGDHWQIPGGHVELGETEIETARREILEETGLEIDNLKFEGAQECIYPEQFEKKVHFIFHDYSARMAGGEIAEKNREMEDHIWIKPEEALKKLKLNPYTKITIERFIEKKDDDYENLYKRALADYQNLLKQTAKEKMEFAVYANENILREILPVYDHLKMALAHHNGEPTDDLPSRQAGWLKGVEHVVKQFKDALVKVGVEEITVKDLPAGLAGKKFDHNLMEAVSSEETDDESLDGQVARQVKAGYRLNGKVIEPAKVVVYKVK